MTNKKLLPAEEQPCNQSPDYTAFEAIRKGLCKSGIDHDSLDFIASSVQDSLKEVGALMPTPKSGAYFILPNGDVAEVLLVTRDGERPRIAMADTVYEPAVESAFGITQLVHSLDPGVYIETKFHIHETSEKRRNRTKERAEEIATEIERQLRGKAVEVNHRHHDSTTWISVEVADDHAEFIVYYTPDKEASQ